MHRYSQKAARFVVLAHYGGEDRGVRSFAVDPAASILEVFASLWPTGKYEAVAGSRFAPTPVRIEIVPDESSIPTIDEPDLFDSGQAAAA